MGAKHGRLMYSTWQLAQRYLRYWWQASNGKGHGVHSPFVFDFIIHVLNDRQAYDCYAPMEQRRRQLLADERVLEIADFGAGSRQGSQQRRSVQQIAGAALKPRKYAQLLHRIARYYQCQTVVELGTSLGVTAGYLAAAPGAKLYTLEGSPAIANVAAEGFAQLQQPGVQQVVGNFDDTLAPLLAGLPQVDLLYIDGNHRYEPTIRYFNQAFPHLTEYSIVVFDDIHWSAEMEQAWAAIKADPRVRLSIDLFFIGLAFFRTDFKVKQDFSIRF